MLFWIPQTWFFACEQKKSWEKVRCKQVRLDKNLFWRKEFARYRQFPLCTGSIPYKNHEKTSVLHKMSVDDRFSLWTGFTVLFLVDKTISTL
jgi:hypothetical protein